MEDVIAFTQDDTARGGSNLNIIVRMLRRRLSGSARVGVGEITKQILLSELTEITYRNDKPDLLD